MLRVLFLRRPLTLTLTLLVAACPSKEEAQAPPPPPADAAAAIEPPEPEKPAGPMRVEGMQTPESVLHDADADVYLVSNINGDPFGEDDNGFISRVSPEGKLVEPRWIDGAREDVVLNAPKGMAISGGVLWVSDIDHLRTFDARTGKPLQAHPIKGAMFLNDVAPGDGGSVYVTDSGFKAGFKPGGGDAVYQVTPDGKARPLLEGKEMGGPNGVLAPGDGSVWVVTFGSNEVYKVAGGKKSDATKLAKGQLDGIVALEGGELLVSSWEGSAIYRGRPGGDFKEVVTGVKSPADIGWDAKRKRILVPIFLENRIEIHELKE